jgi:succinoglycan biosynthesis transport protein ExoP
MADEFSLATLARSVWRRKALVASIIAVCFVMAGVITVALPKIYRAETSVFFPEATETPLTAALGGLAQAPGLSSLVGLSRGSDAAQLCKAIADSYSVRAEICRDFRLQQRFQVEKFEDATDRLRSATLNTITPEGLLVIRVDTTDAQLAADLANAYARVVERRYRNATVARARDEREFLQGRVAEAQRDLRTAEVQLETYQKRGQALLAPDEVPPILQKLSDVRVDQANADVQLEAARRKLTESTAELNRLAAQGGDKRGAESVYAVPWQMNSETIADNPDIAQIRADLVGLEVKLAAARHDLSPEHPDVKRLQSEVDETRGRLATETRKTITAETRTRDPVYAAALQEFVGLETTVIGQEAQVEGLARLVQELEGKAATLPARLLQFSRLEREVRARETVYATLEAQLEAAKLKEQQEQPVYQVLDEAVTPERHDRPKLLVNLVVGLLLGAFLGTAAAAALGIPQPKGTA